MAPTLRGVEAIQQVEAETGQLVAIGFQHCCSRDTLKVKKRLLEGVIGEVQRVEALCLWPRAVSYYQRNNWAGCVADENGWVLDSPLHNALSHLVNLILFFTGKSMHERADVVSMEAELYRAKPIQNFDTVRCVGKLDTGVEASLILSHSSLEKMDPEIRIHGSKGVYVWRFGEPHTFEFDGNVEPMEVESPLDVRAYMFDSIVRILQGDSGIPYCTTEHAKGEVKWVNAVQDAAVTQTIAQEFCRQVEDSEGEVSDTVVDLKRYAVEAYQRNCSFKEAGAPWAIEASQLDLHGYTSFMGRHLDAYRPVLPV
jgi:predicted dehydrogenase